MRTHRFIGDAGAGLDRVALDPAIEGDVVTRDSPSYDTVRRPPNARFADPRPAAIVRCRGAGDVAVALTAAHRAGLRCSVRSGGHDFAGRSSTGDVILDLAPMDRIALRDDGPVTCGAGVRQGDVYDALDADGLTIAGGGGSTVGLSGLVLGGGLGILGRSHGLACDSLVGAEVVLADGRIVACDAERHPDLLWALRGAGAGYLGVVTELTLGTVPAPALTALTMSWAPVHAEAVIDAWQTWSPDGPDELAASLLITAPGDPDAPARVEVSGTMIAAREATLAQLRELVARVGAEPASVDAHHAPHRQILRDLESPDVYLDHQAELSSQFHAEPLPREAIGRLVAELLGERVAGESRELDFMPWGGAYNRVDPTATAFAHRGDRFLLKHTALVSGDAAPARVDRARRWLRASFAAVASTGSGRVYPNFPDPALPAPGEAYFAGNLPRLRALKARYDPLGQLPPL